MRKFLIAVASVGLLAGAACGGGGGNKSTDKTDKGGSTPAAVVKSEGTTWSPDDVTVKAGDTVEWQVNGSIVHDLKGDEGISHKAGSKFTQTHTFSQPGTFSYQCTIHPGMTGTVTVS
ncbi:MAG: plastocyanin [Actinomycetota bacterium]|jgi:plastocyanin